MLKVLDVVFVKFMMIIIIVISIIRNIVSYIKERMQAKGIWKQDPEANIWAQEGWE